MTAPPDRSTADSTAREARTHPGDLDAVRWPAAAAVRTFGDAVEPRPTASTDIFEGEVMHTRKSIVALLGALIAIASLAGTAMAGALKAHRSATRTVVHFPANGPGGENSGMCFWGTSYTQETRNIIWPDSHTDYPVSIDTVPAGG